MQRILDLNRWNNLFPILLILAGASVASIGLGADLFALGGPQGIGPRQVALVISGLAVLLAGVVLISPVNGRYLGEWLLIALAAVAVAFAADLLVINGLPEFLFKQIALVSIAAGVVLTAMVPAAGHLQRSPLEWIRSLQLDRARLLKFLGIVAQLGLLLLVISQFHLENQAFYANLMLLTFYGFVIHYFLPARYRLPFFVLLSLAAILGILGLVNGARLLMVGLGLIGICHLSISFRLRLVLLLVAAGALVAMRVNWLPGLGLDVVWPILASMFMFRLIVYVYDLRHSKAKPTLASTLAYFFLLPNVVFPFFPVVDYSTFRRTYYDEDEHLIYQRGVQWMLRGALQLIIYRAINYYLILAPEEVANTADLIRYLITNFALYIRISGMFHLIIGLLHLFGFNLPPTHLLYFLASSFTDLWRRINIYWKDFMMKVFYYPTYFRVRQWGTMRSLVVATFITFFFTWFLHAYQWFWLRGTFLFTGPDTLFWFLLTLLVIINTLYEARRGRKRSLGQPAPSLLSIAGLALRSAGTFTIMAVLWSLWSSASVRDWLALFSVIEARPSDVAWLVFSFVGLVVIFGVVLWASRPAAGAAAGPEPVAPRRTALVTGGLLLLLYLVGNRSVYSRLGPQVESLMADLTANRLSAREAALLQRGYYEDLTGVDQFNSQLWEIYSKRPTDWPTLTEAGAARETGDNLIVELVPNTRMNFHGALLSINRWGMRDRDYELIPAPGTYRIALTGPSFVMGFGVADNEVLDVLLEDELNREPAGALFSHYEVLNFAVPGYSPIQDLLLLEQRVLPFQPNALFFMSHQREQEAAVLYLADRMAAGAELPYPELVEIAHRAGVVPGMTKVEAERLLIPHGTEILMWTFRRIVQVSQTNGMAPVWIFIPTLEAPLDETEAARLAGLAAQAGFVTMDLSNAYAGRDPNSLVIAYWDKHPNAEGHRLIAAGVYDALRENADAIGLFE